MFSITQSVISVVLGGGAGTRLYPLTAARSKPAVPIAGKYRLVDIPISNCINSRINRIICFNADSIPHRSKQAYQEHLSLQCISHRFC
jgi:glucose-1-phosphate adenylyltransferase